VEDAVCAGEGLLQEGEVGDAPFDELAVDAREVLAVPGREVVDDDDLVLS